MWQCEGDNLKPSVSWLGAVSPLKLPNLAQFLLNLSLMQSQSTGSCTDNTLGRRTDLAHNRDFVAGVEKLESSCHEVLRSYQQTGQIEMK